MTTRKLLIGALAAAALFIGNGREAHAGFGAGLSFGESAGITGEYSLRGRNNGRGRGHVIEATVGTGDEAYAHVVWKFYAKTLVRTKFFSLPIYGGVGPYIAGGDGFLSASGDDGKKGKKGKKEKKGKKGDGGDRQFGARVPIGIAAEFNSFPAHVFLELGAQADSEDFSEIETTTFVGFRWFF